MSTPREALARLGKVQPEIAAQEDKLARLYERRLRLFVALRGLDFDTGEAVPGVDPVPVKVIAREAGVSDVAVGVAISKWRRQFRQETKVG